MFLILSAIAIGGLALMTAWKFYGTIDWDEEPEPSPDLRAMHKKEAELQHIEEILAEANREGKISAAVLQEFGRYAQSEIAAMQAIETAWQQRPRKKSRPDAPN